MSAREASAVDAIAFQLAVALDGYERDVERMVETWLDMDLYGQVSGEIDEIRLFAAGLPQLSVPWVELLIAHAELVHSLWRLRFREQEIDRSMFDAVRTRHTACIASLRARCVRLLARSEAGA
jgi:hypothetical protein